MKKAVMTSVGLIIIVLMLMFLAFNNFNIGIFIPMLGGAVIALWCHLPDNRVVFCLKGLFILLGAFMVIMMTFIAFMPKSNSAKFDEDAVIVLGCGLHGSQPSGNLADRLDATVDYSSQNGNALIVVSGGQGPQEDCTEAEAMYYYLTERGIAPDKIIREENSTSTNENYKFSKAILDKKLGSNYKVVYITNSFHSYRAGKLAELNGLNVRSYSARTSLPSVVPNYCREVFAVLQLWILGK